MSNYRVVLQYDSAKSVFVARVPELEHCGAEGQSRAEAIAHAEEEISAQVANAREHGGTPPIPIDDDASPYSGVMTVHVSRSLHRDLVFQARAEGIDLDQLLSEMLPGALEARMQRGRRPAAMAPARPAAQGVGDEGGGYAGRDRDRDRGRDDRRRGGMSGGRYHAIMEDKASFLEYVRGLDSGGGPGQPGSRGPRRPRRDDRRQGGGGPGGQGGQGGQGGGSGPGSAP